MRRIYAIFIFVCILSTQTQPTYARMNPNRVRITLSAVGDCTFGRDDRFGYHGSFDDYYATHEPEYFFENVAPLFATDDLTIANLEGSLTDAVEAAEKEFIFKGAGKYAEILKYANIDAVNIQNNHIRDYGDTGYRDTLRHLDEQGIGYYGYGHVYITEVKGIKIGLLGYSSFHNGALYTMEKDINALREEGVALVVVSFHGGVENENYPNDTQITLSRRAVDAGADLVLGHHAHVMQGIEIYEGTYIVYGLANFCYGGHKNPADKDTFIYRQTFEFTDGILTDNRRVTLIPARVSSIPERNDFKPTPLYGEDGDRVLRRLFTFSEPFNNIYPPRLLRIYRRLMN